MIWIFVIGLLSGIISGMGIGGGTILIPALILFGGIEQHVAQSVNLTAFIPTAMIAIAIHWKNGNIKYKLATWITISGIAGAMIGSWLAIGLSSRALRISFGIFLMIMGIYEFFRKP
ncbi:MAG: hypothetical protein JG770_2021 [Mahella sp.]|nr:sulfite exporter TauE/SafE family protein [Mahella sp.]MBZ4666768.1 hypothetical protein [Mahella sp.]